MHKKVSVIVPNYNYAVYLSDRLASIEAQSYPIHELIFLDDASSDNSLEIAKSFKDRSNLDIKIFPNMKNSGSVFQQWLKGIEHASGDYLWIAEADDLSDPAFLETAMKGFNDPEVVLSYTLTDIIDEHGNTIQENYRHATDDIDDERWKYDYIHDGKYEIANVFVVKNTIPNASSAVFKKMDFSALKEKISRFTVAGDWFFYVYLLQHGKIAYSSKILNHYRWHPKSVVKNSKNNMRHLDEIVIMQNIIKNQYPVSKEVWNIALAHRKVMKGWLTDNSTA